MAICLYSEGQQVGEQVRLRVPGQISPVEVATISVPWQARIHAEFSSRRDRRVTARSLETAAGWIKLLATAQECCWPSFRGFKEIGKRRHGTIVQIWCPQPEPEHRLTHIALDIPE